MVDHIYFSKGITFGNFKELEYNLSLQHVKNIPSELIYQDTEQQIFKELVRTLDLHISGLNTINLFVDPVSDSSSQSHKGTKKNSKYPPC